MLPNRLRPYRRLTLDLLSVMFVTAVVVGAVVLIDRWLAEVADADRFGDAIGTVQLFVTAVIVIAGAAFAYRKLQLIPRFRAASHRYPNPLSSANRSAVRPHRSDRVPLQ